MRRPRGRIALAVVFCLFALNALAQVALVPFGIASDPPPLVALQFLIGLTGAAAAWGSWTGARWAPVAAVLFGLAGSAMFASLPTILGLPPEARGGLLAAAGTILLFALVAAWHLRRAQAVAHGAGSRATT